MTKLRMLLLAALMVCVAASGCDDAYTYTDGDGTGGGSSGGNGGSSPTGSPLSGVNQSYTTQQALDFFGMQHIPIVPGPVPNFSAAMTPSGPVIYYNPGFVVSPAMRDWFIAHEYGHHFLNQTMTSPPGYPANHQWELAADRYAARVCHHLCPPCNSEAIQFWMAQPQTTPTHPSGIDRAQTIQFAINEQQTVTTSDVLNP
ncbi:MAG: hypothetical protein K8I27_10440 [Planctomycetes bacterium]|nr:hypothetical protein [Planctomycetota bacterium]